MGKPQSIATDPSPISQRDIDKGIENFLTVMAPITIGERETQKRVILQATPNKYTRYELKRKETSNG